MTLKYRFVCATQETIEGFRFRTALGRWLELYQYPFMDLRLFPENKTGLPVLYNRALREAAADPAIMIFAHDDVHLCDFFWPNHILDGLGSFDILGVAGNRRRVPGQLNWHFLDETTRDDLENLSGIVAHGSGLLPGGVSFYGAPGQEVKLLDGVMLIARSETLLANNLMFDERFEFHHYDMDFCRQAEIKKLRMGTATVSVVHESAGGYNDGWRLSCAKYLDKWKS
jgi:hypothetical protein